MRLALAALVVSLFFPVALHAQGAQETREWSTTAWEIRGPDGTARSGDRDGSVAAEVAFHLKEASIWLEINGFREPAVDPVYGEPRRMLARVLPEIEYCGGRPGCSGTARYFADGRVEINDGPLGRMSVRDGRFRNAEVADAFAAVHEMFHGVQKRYAAPANIGWIHEGTAEAVMTAYARLAGYPVAFNTTYYDRPLTESSSRTATEDGGTMAVKAYDREHFWTMLGRDMHSRDEITYLAEFYRKPLHAGGDLPGIGWLDVNLREHGMGGLARYLPYFIARHAREAEFFENEIDIALGDGQSATTPDIRVEPTAAVGYRVTFPRPRDLGLVSVRFLDNRAQALRLVIGDEVFEGDEGSVETADVCDERTCEVPIRVVNVADDAQATYPVTHRLKIDLVEGCGFRYPEGVAGVRYSIHVDGQGPGSLEIRLPGAEAGGRQSLDGPFRGVYRGGSPSGGTLRPSTFEGEMICQDGALDMGGMTQILRGSPVEQMRSTSVETTGRWTMPARPRVGDTLPDVVTTADILIEGDVGLSARTTTSGQRIAARERAPLTTPAARLDPHLRRGVSTWKVTGQMTTAGGLEEDAIMGEMDRTMREMGVDLDSETRAMIEGMMGGLLDRAQAEPVPAQPFTLWYSLDYGLVKMELPGMIIELEETLAAE